MADARTQVIVGTVVQKSGLQTVKVAVRTTKVHPIYKKRYSRTRHFQVHDAAESAKIGDEVKIVPCRPISKTKRWMIAA